MVGLGILPGFISSRAGDVSADGSVVVGWGNSATDTEAFLWDTTHGIRSLRDVLINDFGLSTSLAGWKLEYARGISDDGRVVVGYGFNPNGEREAWIARLDPQPTLAGDYNSDSVVDTADYIVWRYGLDTIVHAERLQRLARPLRPNRRLGATAGSSNSVVPEPATAVLSIIGGLIAMRRRVK